MPKYSQEACLKNKTSATLVKRKNRRATKSNEILKKIETNASKIFKLGQSSSFSKRNRKDDEKIEIEYGFLLIVCMITYSIWFTVDAPKD